MWLYKHFWMISTSLNHCKEMRAEPGRRSLKMPAEKLGPVIAVYFECRFVLSSWLYIYFQNSTSMVNEGLWIGLEVANTPASHLQSAARAIDYLHRTFDVIPEVDATSALSEFSRMRRRVSCTTCMKLSSTKFPCMPSSGEPDLVWVQICTNCCVGSNGPGAIAMRLFQLN